MSFSKDYMAGWNCAHNGQDIRGRFRSEDARYGYGAYQNADVLDKVPFDTREHNPLPDMQSMHDMLNKCMKQFQFYAESHRAKHTKEADEKARVNEQLVDEIKKVLLL